MKLLQNVTSKKHYTVRYMPIMYTLTPKILARNSNLWLLYSVSVFSFCFHSFSFCTVYGDSTIILQRTIKQTMHILSIGSRMQTANASMSGQCIPHETNRIFWLPPERPCTLHFPSTSSLCRLGLKQVRLCRTSASAGNLLEQSSLPN